MQYAEEKEKKEQYFRRHSNEYDIEKLIMKVKYMFAATTFEICVISSFIQD